MFSDMVFNYLIFCIVSAIVLISMVIKIYSDRIEFYNFQKKHLDEQRKIFGIQKNTKNKR